MVKSHVVLRCSFRRIEAAPCKPKPGLAAHGRAITSYHEAGMHGLRCMAGWPACSKNTHARTHARTSPSAIGQVSSVAFQCSILRVTPVLVLATLL